MTVVAGAKHISYHIYTTYVYLFQFTYMYIIMYVLPIYNILVQAIDRQPQKQQF